MPDRDFFTQKSPSMQRGVFCTVISFLSVEGALLGWLRYEIRILLVLFALLELSLVQLVQMLILSYGFVIRRHWTFLVPGIHLSPSSVCR